MMFARLYMLIVSVLLIVEPFMLHSSFTSAGMWFWWLLGFVGLVGVCFEWLYARRKQSDCFEHF